MQKNMSDPQKTDGSNQIRPFSIRLERGPGASPFANSRKYRARAPFSLSLPDGNTPYSRGFLCRLFSVVSDTASGFFPPRNGNFPVCRMRSGPRIRPHFPHLNKKQSRGFQGNFQIGALMTPHSTDIIFTKEKTAPQGCLKALGYSIGERLNRNEIELPFLALN